MAGQRVQTLTRTRAYTFVILFIFYLIVRCVKQLKIASDVFAFLSRSIVCTHL